jgi:hypothetical protein
VSDKKIIAVLGATGSQGGGLVRAILSDPNGAFAARAITRDVNSDKAKELAKLGADVVDPVDPVAREWRAMELVSRWVKQVIAHGRRGYPQILEVRWHVVFRHGLARQRELVAAKEFGATGSPLKSEDVLNRLDVEMNVEVRACRTLAGSSSMRRCWPAVTCCRSQTRASRSSHLMPSR